MEYFAVCRVRCGLCEVKGGVEPAKPVVFKVAMCQPVVLAKLTGGETQGTRRDAIQSDDAPSHRS
jgi:hypothetical protein